MEQPGDDAIPTRATLIKRLKDWQDESSWQDFFDTYWKLIYRVGLKGGLTEVEAQDLVQETMLSVAKHMPTFKYDPQLGSFKAWLLNLTRWRITDQLRKRGPANVNVLVPQDAPTEVYNLRDIPDPNNQDLTQYWDSEWEKNLFEAAVNNVKRKLDPQRYQIFDFYVNKGWPAEKVATAFSIPVDQVYMAKYRVTELIRKEIKRLEKDMT